MTLAEAFGQVLRGLPEERGWSQERLAFASARTRNYVGALERGERSPTLVVLIDVAYGLKMEPAEIVARVAAVAPPTTPRRHPSRRSG